MLKRFPFDTKHLIGYVVAVILQYTCATYMVMFTANIACSAIGAFLFAQSLTKDIRHCLKPKHKSAESKILHRLVLKQQLIEFIQYYSDGKQFSNFAYSVPSH